MVCLPWLSGTRSCHISIWRNWSFPKRWLFSLLHEVSLSLCPYPMPFITLFFCCLSPTLIREGRGSWDRVISPKGPDGIKVSPQWIISPKRIRWHNMIQSCRFTTPKPPRSQLEATWAVLALQKQDVFWILFSLCLRHLQFRTVRFPRGN